MSLQISYLLVINNQAISLTFNHQKIFDNIYTLFRNINIAY